jgi:hypothetical protein
MEETDPTEIENLTAKSSTNKTNHYEKEFFN